jgi:hypothetical protein
MDVAIRRRVVAHAGRACSDAQGEPGAIRRLLGRVRGCDAVWGLGSDCAPDVGDQGFVGCG